MFTIYLFCIIFAVLAFLVHSTFKRYRYWKGKKVPYVEPELLFGNFKDYIYLKKDACCIEAEICERFPEEPYVGVYYGTEPTLIVQDPGLIGLITGKEFHKFNGREISRYSHKEVLTSSIFFSSGDEWKVLKQAFSPLFTSSRLKNLFVLVEKSAIDLEKMLHEDVKVCSTMDIRDVMARYTMDCIGSCFLGVNTQTLVKTDQINPFKVMGQKIFEVSQMRKFLYIIRAMWPAVFYGLRFKAFPDDINIFFLNLYRNVREKRDYKPSERNDTIDYFIAANSPDNFVIGMLVSLFGAGYETSANTLSHVLYELARNEDVQNKALKEVDEYLLRNGGKITYECINELKYLDACVKEALRLYPVLGVVTREVMQDCTLPTGLQLEKGIRIHLPIYYIHRRPDYFPEPERFRPERFLNDVIKPFIYMPFGEGQRLCIGKRFSKMQVLPGLVTVLKNYRLTVAESMPPTLEYEVGSIVTTPKGPILLKFTPRQEKCMKPK